MNNRQTKAVILSSGGIDSTTAMAIAAFQGFEIYSLTFSYGQRHSCELAAAAKVAQRFKAADHLVLETDLTKIGGSALTDDIPVPKDGPDKTQIPITYVPARNIIFLSYALAWAETIGSRDIFIGANAVDYSGYPDCRPEFISAFERMANLGTKTGVEKKGNITIHAPLMEMTKARIIQTGARLGVDYSITWSCYDPAPGGLACGRCDSCRIRKKGFEQAGIPDPTRYA
ncbi:MAG: 7-cyano-7-deazaguanine synthase QueC [Desulfococcus sp. 4484_241]|nr:MAG: 7-cyano-7-deazaguanine synthase QueC [Desulfococcus sp. 4484_241]